MAEAPSTRLKSQWLDALLPEVAFDGWSDRAAQKAADTAGISANERALAAPNGVSDLVEHFFDRAAEDAKTTLSGENLDELKVHERVARGVRVWLDAMAGNKEAVRRAIAWGARPWRAGLPVQRMWTVADMVWTAAGDTSEDYNRYSKRGLLASTLPAIVFHWLDTDDGDAVDAHIVRRLKGASRLGQAGGRILAPILKRA